MLKIQNKDLNNSKTNDEITKSMNKTGTNLSGQWNHEG